MVEQYPKNYSRILKYTRTDILECKKGDFSSFIKLYLGWINPFVVESDTIISIKDFTTKSDIDWNQSIPEIDKQLYKKYNLSKEEIAFIESKVREME